MRNRSHVLLVAMMVAAYGPLALGDDLGAAESVMARQHPTSSHVSVGVIEADTLASVEHAAAHRNPALIARVDPEDLTPPAQPVALSDIGLGEVMPTETLADRIEDTPLTEAELERPCAWAPMLKHALEWSWDAAEPLAVAGGEIAALTWGNNIGIPLLKPTAAWLHGDDLWVKVDVNPAVDWVEADDEDDDGIAEFYGRVPMGPEAEALSTWLREDYIGRKLTPTEMEDALFELASDWYPKLRTVVLEPEMTRPWPNDETEPEVVEELDGAVFENAFAILRSAPYDEPIYTVLLRRGGETEPAPAPSPLAIVPCLWQPNPWQAEAAQWGGSFEAWADSLAPFRRDVQALLNSQPEAIKGLEGLYDFLFFRGDLEYLLAGDLRDQPDERDPYPAIVNFDQQLRARGIDMLVVFIPTKAEVYAEALGDNAPKGGRPYVQPYARKLMAELADAGVQIVDLLPAFVDSRNGPPYLYQLEDTHWTNRGARLAAKLIGDRVKQYGWYADLSPNPAGYSTREVTFTRLGDIVPLLPPAEQAAHRPAELTAQQVMGPDGELYVDDPASPIVMLGDSFTGVFQLEDCKHAGLSAHVAKEIGHPVDLIMAQGSGPTIRTRLARRGAEVIDSKKLVIWTVVSRDLHGYWSPWREVALPE
jgi:alginate O-acetyltransferase complex protein AlgJ